MAKKGATAKKAPAKTSTKTAASKKRTPTPHFIFDANFFIALKEISAKRPYVHLQTVKKQLNMEFYVSGQVFNECPFIVGSDFQEFSKGVQIELVKDDELIQVKKDLNDHGARNQAQDPDLTLIALGKKLRDENELDDIIVVSDDFKLSNNIGSLNYRVKCLSLPAFLQILTTNLTGERGRYWKYIRKRVLKLNLDYMMSRSEQYAPQKKIAWFIQNAIDVAGQGIKLQKNKDIDDSLEEKQSEELKRYEICQTYIRGAKYTTKEFKKIESIKESLEQIKDSRILLAEAKEHLENSEFKLGQNAVMKLQLRLNKSLQLMGAGKLNESDYQFVEKLFASEISKVTFIDAFINIERAQVSRALYALDNTALFSTISRIPETVLSINYIKALLYVFNSLYKRSINQFNFLTKLAEAYGDEHLMLKAHIGSSIITFLTGKKKDAASRVDRIEKTVKDYDILLSALIDSGDYFLAMGFPEIATNLYMKSLELCVDIDKEWKSKVILVKMKRSFMASALASHEQRPMSDITTLIDKWHVLENFEKYNDLMMKFTNFTNLLYSPFEYFTKGRQKFTKYLELPENMRDEWTCVKIYDDEDSPDVLLVGFQDEVGLVGFQVSTDRIFDGVPENYVITIKKGAQIKFIKPKPDNEEHLLCRAIAVIRNEKRDIDIDRRIPVFFKQLKI